MLNCTVKIELRGRDDRVGSLEVEGYLEINEDYGIKVHCSDKDDSECKADIPWTLVGSFEVFDI